MSQTWVTTPQKLEGVIRHFLFLVVDHVKFRALAGWL